MDATVLVSGAARVVASPLQALWRKMRFGPRAELEWSWTRLPLVIAGQSTPKWRSFALFVTASKDEEFVIAAGVVQGAEWWWWIEVAPLSECQRVTGGWGIRPQNRDSVAPESRSDKTVIFVAGGPKTVVFGRWGGPTWPLLLPSLERDPYVALVEVLKAEGAQLEDHQHVMSGARPQR